MPKVKTNSSAKKRFSFTGTGKIKRHHAFHSHILTKKTKKQKRRGKVKQKKMRQSLMILAADGFFLRKIMN